MGEQEVKLNKTKKDKPSTLQLIRQSPFYRNVSGRLSLNDRHLNNNRNRVDISKPNENKDSKLNIPNGGSSVSLLSKKLSFRKPHSVAATPITPDLDDGGFESWTGSCEGLTQLQDIIRRRTNALADETEGRHFPKSQSAFNLTQRQTSPSQPTNTIPSVNYKRHEFPTNTIDVSSNDVFRRSPTSMASDVSRTSSPARPTSLPTASLSYENNFQSRKNTITASTPSTDIWIPPENIVLRKPYETSDRNGYSYNTETNQTRTNSLLLTPSRPVHHSAPSSSSDYNHIISTVPFYTPPAPISSSMLGSRLQPSQNRTYGLVNSSTVPAGLGSSTWQTPTHQPQTVSTPAIQTSTQHSWNPPTPTNVVNQPARRPHSIASSAEYDTSLRRLASNASSSSGYQVQSSSNWSSSSVTGRRPHSIATTSYTAQSSTSALSPSDSGYRSLPSSSSDYQLLKSPVTSAQLVATNSLPNRRLSLPASTQNQLRVATPRPSPTFHGQPFRPVSCGGSPFFVGCTHPFYNNPSKTAAQALQILLQQPRNGFVMSDDRLALLFDILDTQEKFAKLPNSEEEWLQNEKEFEEMWNFPHCLASVDGKHIEIQAPWNSGSEYYNYKSFFSIVLFALVDAKYNFLFADVGAQGRISDGGIFKNCALWEKIEGKTLNAPQPKKLTGREKRVPYVILGDEAFALHENVMKPYSGISENGSKERIVNYRLSRARRVTENSFGILSAVFRVLRRPMLLEPDSQRCGSYNSLFAQFP